MLFVVEIDASDNAVSASLNQHNRPLFFFRVECGPKMNSIIPVWKKTS